MATPLLLQAQVTEVWNLTPNRLIPDGDPSGLSLAPTLPSAIASIASVTVNLNITGEFNGDLYSYIRHSSGFAVLLNRPGKTAANPYGYADSGMNVTFQDGAANGDIHVYQNVTIPPAGSPLTGTWQPDDRNVDPTTVLDTSPRTTALADFNGLNAAGTWTLFLADLQSGGTNQINSWSLTIVGQAYPTLTWANPAAIVYGTALGASQLNATATYNSTNVPGTLTYTPALGKVLNAGQGQTLSVTFTPTDAATFLPITTNVTINVNPAPLTVAAQPQTITYGAGVPATTVSYSGFVNGDTSASLTTPPTVSSARSGVVNAGTYGGNYTASGAMDGNYAISYVNGSLTVNPAVLTVTATGPGKTYGTALTAGTSTANFTATGMQNGETVASVTLTPNAAGLSATTAAGAAYAVTPSAATGTINANNYTITYNAYSGTVGTAALTVTANAQSKTYGQTVVFGSGSTLFTSSGLQNGETIGSVTLAVGGNGGAPTASAGSYTITPSAATGGTFQAGNYAITYLPGTLTITQATTAGMIGSSPNPAGPGTNVTFTMTVSPVAPGAGTPSGTVNFRTNGSIGGTGTLSGGIATATFTTSTLTNGSDTVVAEYAGDINFVGITNSLVQVIDTPVAPPLTIQRYPTEGVQVKVSTILANCSDVDGASLTIAAVSATSANNATITESGGWVFYTPPAGFTSADSFTYTVTDAYGISAVGTITVAIEVNNTQSQNLAITILGGGSVLIIGNGIPGYTYRVQFTTTLNPPNWQNIGTVTADSTGAFQYPTTAAGYYRTAYP